MLWGFLYSNLNFCFFLITCTFLCTFQFKLCTGRYFRLLRKKFHWIILSLSLHYNKTVWHVLVNKMIVSLIISDTTVCASLHFWLHNKPDMIFHFFSIISIIFFSVSWIIVLKHFKNIKWRRDLLCDHKLKGKGLSWNLTTDSIFFN